MAASLSMDVRRRFERLIDGGMSARGAAARLMLSPSTGVRLAGKVRAGEDLAPARRGRRPGGGKLGGHRATLLEMVTANRDVTMPERACALEDAGLPPCGGSAAPSTFILTKPSQNSHVSGTFAAVTRLIKLLPRRRIISEA